VSRRHGSRVPFQSGNCVPVCPGTDRRAQRPAVVGQTSQFWWDNVSLGVAESKMPLQTDPSVRSLRLWVRGLIRVEFAIYLS
jgi:hypothetical protein